MCANSEKNYLMSLRKKVMMTDLDEFKELITKAKPLVSISNEEWSEAYNEFIRKERFKPLDERKRVEFKKILTELLS